MPLSLDGTGSITGIVTVSISDDLAHVGDTNTKISFPSDDTIAVETAGTEKIRINSSGQMGLGTNNPNANFHIKSTFPAIRLEDDSDYSQIDANGGSLRLLADAGNASSNSNILFSVDGDERVRIISSGAVGIGTISPTENIHIHQSDSAQNTIVFTNSANSDYPFYIGIDSDEQGYIWNNKNDNIVIGTGNSERLRITNSGKINLSTNISANTQLYVHSDDLHRFYPNNDMGACYTQYINTNYYGTDSLTDNTTKIALRSDVDYFATTGTETSGSRAYVYGHYSNVELHKNCYDGRGIYSFIKTSADNQSYTQRLYGIYGYAQGYALGGSNKNISIYGGYFLGYRGGDINEGSCFGIYARAHNVNTATGGGSGNTGTMYGAYFECEQDQSTTITDMYGVRSYLDRDGGTIQNSYLFYGSHGGDTSFNNRWGIYIQDSAKNYLYGNLEITGTFEKGTDNFRIPHPLVGLSTTKDLVHSVIEGPQMDLIYRGKTTLVAGISTINIDTKAGMTEGTFVALCRDIQCFTSNETGWTAVKGSVTGNKITIIAQDNACTDTISWMVVGERQDDTAKSLNMTDDDGNLIVEPEIEEDVDRTSLQELYPHL